MPDPAVLGLLTSGSSSGVVGLCTAEGEPFATRGWSVLVLEEEPLRLRVLLATGSMARVGRRPGDGSRFPMALTTANVTTLRAVQVKGVAHSLEEATEADMARYHAYTAAFVDAVHEIDGLPVEILRRWPPLDLCAATLEVQAIFDQTPGPGAGAPLEATGS